MSDAENVGPSSPALRPKACEVKVSVSEKEIEILWTGHYLLAGADNEAQQLHVVSVW